eukprot:TRINITY_DN1300_c0_g1_i1.p1 TRINITY_DN1300_c0_g1~~TRINITY_DN1300_c0_g1_i1.p1  ORF type:complete len:1068 (+),score=455.69 TRINITY_DN1300_c0_g1_i1:308-3205(+)
MKATDKVAMINLIDLAGSERQSGTGASGQTLKEGCAINKSLSALGNVISALAKNSGGKKKEKVPYRDSVLTKLLMNSLGGNAKTVMIAAISPADVNYPETLSTLRYADRAKQIKNKAIINEDPNEKLIRGLKDEIEKLKQQLSGGPAVVPADMEGLLEKEREAIRKKMEEEKAAEMEQYREMMEALKKAEEEEGISWEEKLKQAQERAADLSDAAGGDDSEIIEKKKDIPHMMNLDEDQAFNNKIVHFFEKETTIIGKKNNDNPPEIVLGGLGIQDQHCSVSRNEEVLQLIPGIGKVLLNGVDVQEATTLKHCDRIIIGNNHVFLVRFPWDVTEGDLDQSEHSWDHAIAEANENAMSAFAESDEDREKREKESAEMADKIAKMEEEMKQQRDAAKAAEEEMQQKLKEQQEALAREQAETAEAEANEKVEKEKLRLMEEFEKQQEDMRKQQEELESRLKEQIQRTEGLVKKKEQERRQRSLLDEKLLKMLPLVTEANSICEEFEKPLSFGVKLISESALDEFTVPVTEVWVKVQNTERDLPPVMWKDEKFTDRLFDMRELYQTFIDADKNPMVITSLKPADDPFYDPPEAQTIGKSMVYLNALSYLLDASDPTPISNYAGQEMGQLMPSLTPYLLDDNGDIIPDSDIFEDSIAAYEGKRMRLNVTIRGMRGLPKALCAKTHCKFQFYLDSTVYSTDENEKATINPKMDYSVDIEQVITKEFVAYLENGRVEFEVLGFPNIETKDVTTVLAERNIAACTPAQLKEMDSELSTLRTQAATFESNLKTSEAAVEKLTSDNKELSEQLTAANKLVKEHDASILSLKDKVTSLETENTKNSTEIQNKQKALDEALKNQEELKQQHLQAMNDIQKKLSEAEQKFNDVNANGTDQLVALQTTKTQLVMTEDRLKQAESKNEKLEESEKGALQDKQKLEIKLATTATELTNVKAELERKNNEVVVKQKGGCIIM